MDDQKIYANDHGFGSANTAAQNTTALTTLLGNATGRTIYIREGEYEVADLGVVDGLRLFGEGKVSLLGLKARLTGNIELRNFSVLSSGRVFELYNNIPSLIVEGVEIQQAYQGFYYINYEAGSVGEIVFKGCTFRNANAVSGNTMAAISIRYASSIGSALVEGCLIENMMSFEGDPFYGIWIGEDPTDTDNSNIKILSNTLRNSGISGNEAILIGSGLRAQGKAITLASNIVENCRWVNAIYAQCEGGVINGNNISDPLGGGIAVKGSKNVSITGNVVTGRCNYRAAIRLHGRGVVSGNECSVHVDSLEDGQPLGSTADAGYSFETTGGDGTTLICGNNLKSNRGVYINDRDAIKLSDNYIECTSEDSQHIALYAKSNNGASLDFYMNGNVVLARGRSVSTSNLNNVFLNSNRFVSDNISDNMAVWNVMEGAEIRGDSYDLNGVNSPSGANYIFSVLADSNATSDIVVDDVQIRTAAEMDNMITLSPSNSQKVDLSLDVRCSGVATHADRAVVRVVSNFSRMSVCNSQFDCNASNIINYDFSGAITNVIVTGNQFLKPFDKILKLKSDASISASYIDGNIDASLL